MAIKDEWRLHEKQRGYKIVDEDLYKDWRRDYTHFFLLVFGIIIVLGVGAIATSYRLEGAEDKIQDFNRGCVIQNPSEGIECVLTTQEPRHASCINTEELSEVELWNK